MQTIAIFGVGLIGGSLGLALRQAGFTGRILGVSSPATVKAAVERGAIDSGVDLAQAVEQADVIYLAQPISTILATLELLGPALRRPGTLVTDAGSTKSEIVAKARAVLKAGQFLGGHPMAGKEARGVAAADADLFRGRPYIFTPAHSDELCTPAASGFIKWVERCGALPVQFDPAAHDGAVAWTSHRPQLASTALAGILSQEFTVRGSSLPPFGPGLADMTRLALSPFDVWHDILLTNRNEIGHALDVYIDKLTEFRQNLTTSDLRHDFDNAAALAASVRGRR